MLFRKLAGVLLAMLVPGVLAQSNWRFANPRPHGNNIIDLAMRDGVVWQVGDRGSVYTSSDLDSWTRHETGVRNSLRSIAFFGGRAFISGEGGLILSGSTADSLRPRFLNTADWLESVAASETALVAVGDNGAIYRSTDGQNWTRRGNFTAWLRGVAYGGGNFVCVGDAGFVATSPDGDTWTTRAGTAADLNGVTFVNDTFWLVGNGGVVLTNTFRFSFNPVNVGVTNNLFAVAGNANEILIAGELMLLAGKPGGPWVSQVGTHVSVPAPTWPYYSALWDGRLFLVGGRTGMKVEGFRTNSTGPLQWYPEPQPTRNWLWSVTQADEIFAAVGASGTIVTSHDGRDWTAEVVPATARGEILLGVGGNAKALVAAATAGKLLVSPGLTTNVVSTNASGTRQTNVVKLLGIYWNAVNSTATDDLQGVAANNSTYVVTGAKGTILTSPNGTNWTRRISGTQVFLSGVTAFGNGFVACGDSGVILQSADGLLWTPRNSRTTSWVYSVRHLGGKLVAVGQGGLILTSDDGIQWTQRASGTTEWINDVGYARNQWVAVAGGGTLIASSDTVNWSATKSITSRSLYGIATDAQQMVAVGLEGVILRNQLAIATTPVNFLSFGAQSGTSVFLFGGAQGQRFTLEGSANLTGWTSLANLEIENAAGTLIHQQPNGPANTMFFRTRLLP